MSGILAARVMDMLPSPNNDFLDLCVYNSRLFKEDALFQMENEVDMATMKYFPTRIWPGDDYVKYWDNLSGNTWTVQRQLTYN